MEQIGTTLFDQGRAAAQHLWKEGLSAGSIDDPIHAEFARGALTELEKLQKGTPGILKEVLDGAQISAEQLNVQAFHGILEIVQNADDLGAREVRVAVRKSGGRAKLLIVHNGDRVNLDHIIAMTLAFVTTKRGDPRAKGRFGIGLKTLSRLGQKLTVHCAPYDFVIENNSIRSTSGAGHIPRFFNPRSTDTLLEITLEPGFDETEFRAWFSELGAESLLFLDSVRAFRFFDVGRGRNAVIHKITVASSQKVRFPLLSEIGQRTTLREPRNGRSWIRYEIDRKVPSNLKRRHKAIGETTPFGVAIPTRIRGNGRLYAGLPLGTRIELPLSLNAQFDPDTARRGIQHVKLNEWLLRRLAELIVSASLDLIEAEPAVAWTAIPLKEEGSVADDAWLSRRISDLVAAVQSKANGKLKLSIEGEPRRLRKVAYEAESINQLISQPELDGLRPGLVLIPEPYRDLAGRWRSVLAELGEATEICTSEAIELFDWEEEELSHRDAHWFVKLARAALDESLGWKIQHQKSILTEGGKRIVPPDPDYHGEVLVKSADSNSLSARLGLSHTIHPIYLSRWSDAVVVRKWLEEHSMLHEGPDSENTLRALANRENQDEPLPLADEDLLAIRDMVEGIPSELSEELGPGIGRALAVDVQRWQRNKRIRSTARLAESYLPASIEDRKDGWPKAAHHTPDINWIDPRYRKLLQRGKGSRKRGGQRQALGAQGLFKLLGAETAPRLIEPERYETRYDDQASPIDRRELSNVQREKLAEFQRYATHLKSDRRSPDLLLVLRDIRRERGTRRRRERVRALISTLEREWSRMYSRFLESEAVYSDYTWQRAGIIPASWIAAAMDEPWLRNEAGKPISPRFSVVRTRGTEAIYGEDREHFVRELTEADAASPVIRAIGIETDPQVSELIEQLTEMRASRETPSNRDLDLRYAAIATNCKSRNPAPDVFVGDITVRQLRSRFGAHRKKPGLIYKNGGWLPPSRVYLGAPIFGGRRAFVSEKSAASPLWRTLNIKAPSIADCIDVLEEMSAEKNEAPDEQVLVNTYLYLEQTLKDVSRQQATRLRNLPLWTGASWRRGRPIYLPLVHDIADELSRHIPVWQLPLGANVVPNLVQAAKVDVLTPDSFYPIAHTHAFRDGTPLNRQFQSAVELLRDWLARKDPVLAHSLSVPWENLSNARIACDPELSIELRIDGRTSCKVQASAHLSLDPLTFYFKDPEVIGNDDVGGAILASLFSEGDHDKLALAWSRCWANADAGLSGSVKIVEDEADDNSLQSLFEQASGKTVRRPPVRSQRTKPKRQDNNKVPSEPEVRRLKSIEQFSDKTVGLVATDPKNKGKISKRRGLRDRIPKGRLIRLGRRPASQSAPLDYSETEKEDFALQILQFAINGEITDLQDYRHLRGVGADALDKLRRYFEIKAYYGPLPDEITLTANEIERASIEREKFFLAVISGLEEGYETVVKIIANPLKNLKPKTTTSMTLVGVSSARSGIEVRFPVSDDKEDSP